MNEARKCPNCGAEVAHDAIVCVHCGINMLTGFKVQQHSVIEEEEDITLGYRVLMLMGEYCPGLFRPFIIVATLVLTAVGWGAIVMALYLFRLGAYFTPFFIGAAGFIVYAQAIALMMTGEFWVLHDALVEFEGAKWTVFFVALLLPMFTAFGIYKISVDRKGKRRRGMMMQVMDGKALARSVVATWPEHGRGDRCLVREVEGRGLRRAERGLPHGSGGEPPRAGETPAMRRRHVRPTEVESFDLGGRIGYTGTL